MDEERLRAWAVSAPKSYARVVADASREIARRTPASRWFPFFGFDHPPGCGSRVLDRLSDLGIFRVYERVLDLGGGLGGPARWLARRRGCRVVSLIEVPEMAAAAAWLTARAGLLAQVSVAAGLVSRLPFVDASFTHAWSVEGLPPGEPGEGLWSELFRVVRPGGQVALQSWIAPAGAAAAGEGLRLEGIVRGLAQAGFVDVRPVEVSVIPREPSAVAEILRERIVAALGPFDPPPIPPAPPPGRQRWQIFASRPA